MTRDMIMHDWTLDKMLDLMLSKDSEIEQKPEFGHDTVVFVHGIIDTVSMMQHISFNAARWKLICALFACDFLEDDIIWFNIDSDGVDIIRG